MNTVYFYIIINASAKYICMLLCMQTVKLLLTLYLVIISTTLKLYSNSLERQKSIGME